MRIILLLLIACNISLAAVSQTPLYGDFGYNNPLNDSSALHKKWSVSMSTGFMGGHGYLLPVIGVQLNRRLTNNLFAFTGISSFNFMRTPPMFNNNQWSVSKSIQAGLMYVNDAKTFSISGSIGVSNSHYPYRAVIQKQPMFTGTRQ